MNAIKVMKERLLRKLEENKKAHTAEYEAVLAEYRRTLAERLRDLLTRAEAGEDVPHEVELDRPRSYAKEYGRAIEMLEWDQTDTVTLSSSQFSCYVLDDWAWKEEFRNLNRNYISRR